MRKSTARRSSRASTRRATSYIHTTHYAPTFLLSPSPRAQLLSRVSLALALTRKDRPVAATARTSCSWSISEPRSPMRLIGAADASRETEREGARERETQWLSAVSAIGRTARASIGSVRTDRSRRSEEGGRSANYGTAKQRTRTRLFILSPPAVPLCVYPGVVRCAPVPRCRFGEVFQ